MCIRDRLYTVNPRLDSTATIIPYVGEITPEIKKAAGETDEVMAKGGMITKIEAAEIVTASGIAVSYTHLDVYKRQDLYRKLLQFQQPQF